MILLGEHFSSDDQSRHSEWLRRRQWFIKAKQDHHRKEEIADRQDDEILTFATEAVIATQIQIKEFEARIDAYEAKLDTYDQKLTAYDIAITKALVENTNLLEFIEQQLADVDAELLSLLAQAFVLEDGRRVFKSEDGSYVIDENDKQVTRDEVDFDLVTGPTAETYLSKKLEKTRLLEAQTDALDERDKLHSAQDKIDALKNDVSDARLKIGEARTVIAEGDITLDELEDLDSELEDAMPLSTLPTLPASAMKHLSGIENIADAPNAKAEFFAIANSNPVRIVQTTTPEQTPIFDPMG